MTKEIITAAAFAAVLLVSCASWTPAQRVLVCQESLRILVQPECVRLAEVGEDYVALCDEVVSGAIVACDSGGDPALLCPTIASKASLCDRVGSDPRDVATCERVIRAAGLACTIALAGE